MSSSTGALGKFAIDIGAYLALTKGVSILFAKIGAGKGFLLMSSTPLTRSSYHADADFAALQAARNAVYLGA